MAGSDRVIVSLPMETDGALISQFLALLNLHGYRTRVEAAPVGRGGRGRRIKIHGDVPEGEE